MKLNQLIWYYEYRDLYGSQVTKRSVFMYDLWTSSAGYRVRDSRLHSCVYIYIHVYIPILHLHSGIVCLESCTLEKVDGQGIRYLHEDKQIRVGRTNYMYIRDLDVQ